MNFLDFVAWKIDVYFWGEKIQSKLLFTFSTTVLTIDFHEWELNNIETAGVLAFLSPLGGKLLLADA